MMELPAKPSRQIQVGLKVYHWDVVRYEESYLAGATEISKRLTKAAGTVHERKHNWNQT